MKCLLTWTERGLLRLLCKLSTRQNLHLKAKMFSFRSKYFVYRYLKRAPQKLSFCFKCPDTGQHTVLDSKFHVFFFFGRSMNKKCHVENARGAFYIVPWLLFSNNCFPTSVNSWFCAYFNRQHSWNKKTCLNEDGWSSVNWHRNPHIRTNGLRTSDWNLAPKAPYILEPVQSDKLTKLL